MAKTIRKLADGQTNFYTGYEASQQGQRTEELIKVLFRDRFNLETASKEEDLTRDLDFRMDWKGERIAVSLKDESKAPEYAAKKGYTVPDIYFEIGRHNRKTGHWEESTWFHGKDHVTHYMIAWWLDGGQTLELRIYSRADIRKYLYLRYTTWQPTYRPFSSERSPQGWHKVCRLSPEVAKTQTRLYDNAECGYIPSDAVPCDLLRFRYNESGSLEEIV